MLFDLVVSENKFSLICLTFTGTLNQLHFTLLFMFTSFRTISYFSVFHLVVFMEHACLLVGVISNWKSGTLNIYRGGFTIRWTRQSPRAADFRGRQILGKIKNLLYRARLFMKNQNNVRRSCRPLIQVGMPPSHTQRHSAVTGRRRDYRIRTDYIGLHDITNAMQAVAL